MRLPEKADLMPWFARALSSDGTRLLRRSIHRVKAGLRREANLVEVFINPRDPFGLPLLQALGSLRDRFDVRFLEAEPAEDGLEPATEAMSTLWCATGQPAPTAELKESHRDRLAENDRTLRQLGHYQGSMACYLGEWFWGIDRLDHLERSLIRQKLNRAEGETATFTRTWSDLGAAGSAHADAWPVRTRRKKVVHLSRHQTRGQ